ncbi:placenta-specific gene 8 protein-like [Hemicordylus capensis]|uniref:placenta-specific gene 8 protein-like n=1 Tax=Hemicordylus capensis TaxID=884348 RepID=UPI0023026BE7|nr:placenta-specific gene 8 protein-like [Hemicordylus capensis]
MATQAVIKSQPQVVVVQPQRGQWQTDLFDCCSDVEVCLCGIFCYECLGCQVAADMNECCLCGTGMPMRAVYRTKYGIPGDLMGDFFTVLLCPACSLCQLKRDIKKRRQMGIF